MKKSHIPFLLSFIMCSCASNNNGNNPNLIIDPSYDFVAPNSSNKLVSGTFIEFKITGNVNGIISGYITNNIFNMDNNVILFQMGDKIEGKYIFDSKKCSLSSLILINSTGFKLPLVDYYLMKNGVTFNCNPKDGINGFPVNNYGLKLVSVDNLPIITGGVTVPDISENYENLDTAKQYKIIANKQNLTYIPTIVADNGIQTAIKFENKVIHTPFYLNGDKKMLPINYSVNGSIGSNLMILDGVYSEIVFFNNQNESYGEVHILRSKTPDTNNTIIKNLYSQKYNFYKQSTGMQDTYTPNIYQTNQTQQPNQVSLYNKNITNDEAAILAASKVSASDSVNQPNSNANMIQVKQPDSNTQIYKYSNNGSVPPISGSSNNSMATAPDTTNQPSSPDLPNPMGISIMKQLNFN